MKERQNSAKKRISSSVYGLLVFFGISIALSVIIIVSILLKAFERDFIKETMRDLESTSNGIMAQLSSWANVLKGADSIVACRPALCRTFMQRDEASMKNMLVAMLSALDIDRAVLTDEEGRVICSSHEDIAIGEDFVRFQSVKDAVLLKKTSMSFGAVASIPCGEVYASPMLTAQGKLLGSLVFIYDLTAQRFINLLTSYGIDASVFWGTVRVASTLPDVVGTRLDNPEVEEQVLKKGLVYVGKVSVNGQQFFAVYAPLKNEDGSVAGMYFVAREVGLIQEVTGSLFKLTIPVCLVIVGLLIVVLVQRVSYDRKVLSLRVNQLGKKLNWDTLTGANTRSFGIDELSHCFSNFLRGFSSPAIMMLDVDNFKGINDSYGHEAGDIVLKQLVSGIYGECRTSDKIIRWGGDEFVGIFEGMRAAVCKNIAENILQSVENMKFHFNENEMHVTVSIGFSFFKKGDAGYEDALCRADEALYQSKNRGKNTFSVCL